MVPHLSLLPKHIAWWDAKTQRCCRGNREKSTVITIHVHCPSGEYEVLLLQRKLFLAGLVQLHELICASGETICETSTSDPCSDRSNGSHCLVDASYQSSLSKMYYIEHINYYNNLFEHSSGILRHGTSNVQYAFG